MTAEPKLSVTDLDHFRGILQELSAMGAELARALRRVPAPDDAAVAALRSQTGALLRLATIYERLSRAIRCTIRLDQCFADPEGETLERGLVIRMIGAICGDLQAACSWLPAGLRPAQVEALAELKARASAVPTASILPFRPKR